MRHCARKTLSGLIAAAVLAAVGAGSPAAATPATAPTDERAGERVWLGVELGPMPPPLARHLGVPPRAPMVLNVYADSPADACGLEPDDILVEVDGRSTEAGIGWFGDYVRSRAPGETLRLVVVRKGQRQEMTATLAALPSDRHKLRMKFDVPPDPPFHRMLGLRGKILRPGPGGDGWIEEDLGELLEPWEGEELRFETDDPALAEKWMGQLRRWFEGDRPTPPEWKIDEAMRCDRRGRVTHVVREPDGRYTVRRYQREDGREKAEVKTYPSLQALREADPEAAALLAPPPGDFAPDGSPTAPYIEALREYLDRLREWERQRPEFRGFREWDERFFRGPMERFREFYGRWRGPEPQEPQARRPDGGEHPAAPPATPPGPPPPPSAAPGSPPPPPPPPGQPGEPRPPEMVGQTRYSFHCLPDGRIDVTIQGPEGELRMTFESIDRLRADEPALYRRYEAMRQQARQ